ncbi:MAG: hypothetical protein ACRC9R_08790 [Enterovibrio sp.]
MINPNGSPRILASAAGDDENNGNNNNIVVQATNTGETLQTASLGAGMLLADDVSLGEVGALLQEARELALDAGRRPADSNILDGVPPLQGFEPEQNRDALQQREQDLIVLRQLRQQRRHVQSTTTQQLPSAMTRLSSGAISSHNGGHDFRVLQNCCGEHSLSALACLLGGQVRFDISNYGRENEPISLMDAISPQDLFCVGNNGAPNYQAWFSSLDSRIPYLLRIGTQLGEGHHLVLTNYQGSWYAIDTSSDLPILLVTQNGQVLTGNCHSLFDEPRRGIPWGGRFTDYCIMYSPVDIHLLQTLLQHLRQQRNQTRYQR